MKNCTLESERLVTENYKNVAKYDKRIVNTKILQKEENSGTPVFGYPDTEASKSMIHLSGHASINGHSISRFLMCRSQSMY